MKNFKIGFHRYIPLFQDNFDELIMYASFLHKFYEQLLIFQMIFSIFPTIQLIIKKKKLNKFTRFLFDFVQKKTEFNLMSIGDHFQSNLFYFHILERNIMNILLQLIILNSNINIYIYISSYKTFLLKYFIKLILLNFY